MAHPLSLLGWPLILCLALLAVVSSAAVFRYWNRFPGSTLVRNGARLALLVVAQVSTVLLVLALVNDQLLYYTSWPGVGGADATGAIVQAYGQGAPARPSRGSARPRLHVSPLRLVDPPRGHGSLGQLQVLGVANWSSRQQWSTRGKVLSVSIHGDQSGLGQQAYVYLPPQYFQRGWAHHRFPAVEVLTGYPGSAQAQLTVFNLPGIALKQVRQHHSTPMIYVMLEPAVVPPRDTECTDIPQGPQVETFLADEAPSALQAAFRVEPSDWGVMGYSTGGYCATKIVMSHLAEFRAGASLSGYYHTLHDVTTGNLWGGSRELQHFNDPEWLLKHNPAPPVSLLITTSQQETRSDGYPDAMRFLHEVKAPMKVTAVIERHGGHDDATWIRELPTVVRWLSGHLATRA